MARLIFVDPVFAGQVYELTLERIPVGRSNKNKLVIRDESVSLEHCEILVNGPEVIVRDLESTNGTFIEATRLKKQAQLKSGQTVRFGSVKARLELDEPTENSDASEITAIHSLDRFRREQAQPPPDPATCRLVSPQKVTADEQTILMPRSSVAPANPAVTAPVPVSPRKKSAAPWILALIFAVVAFVLFLVLRK